MKKILFILILLAFSLGCIHAKESKINIKIIQTSDIHGNYFPYNFITRENGSGSLARISTYVKEQRKVSGDGVILLDNGDILQGQPTAYFYNFMDTISPHLCSEIMNYMSYDAGTMGNHDTETGHKVFDRWISQCRFPILGANIINDSSSSPYLQPYKIINRNGLKIAVLGMITPGIPAWLPQSLWKGLHFDDMESSATKWIKIIKEIEHPDLTIGLFHAGQSGNILANKYDENASLKVAMNVPGFDIVLMGHDHLRENKKITNILGDTVLVMNPANNGNFISNIDISFIKRSDGKSSKSIKGTLINVNNIEPDQEFVTHFNRQFDAVKSFVSQKIGFFQNAISTRDAYFGSSSFIDFIHTLQLSISGAEISFAAPLSFDARIDSGYIYMNDMFNLYKYENMLYVMELTGQEIKNYLEYSYSLWTNQMHSSKDDLLLFRTEKKDAEDYRATLLNPIYNFDSAAGIIYTVDVSKPYGQKISIKSTSNGDAFDFSRKYKVALNSYRGNGGGEHLTRGAGIAQEKLSERIVFSTDKDLRFYMIKYIQEKQMLNPLPLNTWHFIPEEWIDKASKRDYITLFK